MRMSMRRFTRLTNAFSKKLENLQAAVALHFAHYNLVRLHKTLRVTPAMAAGVTDRLWSLEELVERTSEEGGRCGQSRPRNRQQSACWSFSRRRGRLVFVRRDRPGDIPSLRIYWSR